MLGKIVVAVLTAMLGLIVIMAAAVGGIAVLLTGGTSNICAPSGPGHGSVDGYGPEQIGNAATIVAVGRQMRVPEQGWVVAIAAAMQESGLHNLDHGDRDSLGLFQQRPSQGWGTPAQIMNPVYSATQFYRHLLAIPDWPLMSVNDAAQAVEQSGLPQAYAAHEQAARHVVVAAVGTASC